MVFSSMLADITAGACGAFNASGGTRSKGATAARYLVHSAICVRSIALDFVRRYFAQKKRTGDTQGYMGWGN
jgi:hypothetical protein